MQRIIPYLGIVAAIIVWVIFASFSSSGNFSDVSYSTSTISILPNTPFSSHEENSSETATSSSFKPTPKIIPKKFAPQTSTTSVSSQPASEPSNVRQQTLNSIPQVSQLLENISFDASATALRAALVNIICSVPIGSGLRSISGSGVIVDSKGIILTNAHVAQYLLLSDRGASCTIRSGSPATDKYTASLIFISPLWLRTNSNVLTQTLPNGTGEYDFAFLAITGSKTNYVLPSAFPYVSLAKNPPTTGTQVVIATYGAQFLDSSQVESSLSPTVVFGSIKDVFTFKTNTVDVISLGGSAAAQEGSSGGGVVNSSGELVGTITTSTVTGSTDTRKLDAITASYIRYEFASEADQDLDVFFSQPSATLVSKFAPQISSLEAIITANL